MIKKTQLMVFLFFFVFLISCLEVHDAPAASLTTTPVKHVIVIFQENISFDHYFATYPNALNLPGEPLFLPVKGTPSVNGLNEDLLSRNHNAMNPWRMSRLKAVTCSQDHEYKAEQMAYHNGLLDKFVEFTGNKQNGCDPKQVMGYFDGNTVTALWNYAQHFAMSDNSFGTTFGPSTPGALNLVSGQTHGASPVALVFKGEIKVAGGTVLSDIDPAYDDCSKNPVIAMSGKNIGDLLNKNGITWGWFEGGFKPTERIASGKNAVCGASHTVSNGKRQMDYIPHHEPFQYYESTANPHHLRPTASSMVGHSDRANHQYDLSDFWDAIAAGNLPEVSFLKAPGYQDGHPGYSDPLTEQAFLVQAINRLQKTPFWKNMAIIISYDDSDGSYDHVMPPIINQSAGTSDMLTGVGQCGTLPYGSYPGRCGYGPRLPLIVSSPFSKVNFVDHSLTDQTSIIRFIEDNWRLGRIGNGSYDERAGSLDNMFDFTYGNPERHLFLDMDTGQPVN